MAPYYQPRLSAQGRERDVTGQRTVQNHLEGREKLFKWLPVLKKPFFLHRRQNAGLLPMGLELLSLRT